MEEQVQLLLEEVTEGTPPSSARLHHATLLIVEDDEADRRALRRSLNKAGDRFAIHEASTAETALTLYARLEPDCVLLDHHLPNCTGLEFLKRLTDRGLRVTNTVILITGDESQRLGVAAMKLGVSEVLSKNALSEIDLARVVDEVLDLRDKRSEEARLVYAEKLASLSQLVAGAAHEINNPAAIARLTLSAVSDAMKETSERSGVEFEEVERLRNLVQAADDALGRIGLVVRELERQTGSALGHIHALNLNQAVHAARPSIERLMNGGDRVVFHMDSDANFVGDAVQLSRVIVDLVENALEATQGKGAVEVSTRSQDTFVELTVDDDGPGVDVELRDRIFEPLFTTHRARGALGMGLARASAIVERHGGTLTTERSPRGGARFAIRIPVSNMEHPRSKKRAMRPTRATNNPRILIVDDEPAIRDSYKRVLRSQYDVDVAASAEEAFELIESVEYDAILCDVIMPGEDGVTFAQRLSEKYPQQADALMFCTGGVLEAAQERFLSGWVNGYLRKPLSAQELSECLGSFIKERVALQQS